MGKVSILRRTTSSAAVLALLGAVSTQLAVASPPQRYGPDDLRFTYEASFTSKKPAKPTGLRQAIDYVNPDDPAAKPPSISQVHIVLPKGSRIDPGVPPVCSASDAELILAGAMACPPETRIGGGTLDADTGAPGEVGTFPRTIETDGDFFNGDGDGDGDLILLLESTNAPAPVRIPAHFEVGERSFTSSVPPLPGLPPPDPFLAIDEVTNALDRVVSADSGAGYITTPDRCPRTRRWTFTAEVTYRDGVVQTQQSTMRCRR